MSCKVFFTGDFLVTKNLNKEFLSNKLKEKINENDIVCCNLEGPIIEEGIPKKEKVGPNISNGIENTKYLIQNNFNLFCLANNHIYDYGKKGIENTLRFLDKNNVNYIGASVDNYNMYKRLDLIVNKEKIGIINIAENGFGAAVEENYGYAYMLNDHIENLIKESKQNNDFTIIICHAGAEQWEIPLPEIRKLYKQFIDIGADVIIGHHPHVPQGYEIYKERVIFYSLGNFMFNMKDEFLYKHTYCVSIKLEKTKKIQFEIIPTCIINEKVEIDNSDKVKEIERRTKILNNDKAYMELINSYCLEYYNNIYKKLYYKVAGIYKGGIKEKAKQFIKKYILMEKFQDKVLYHNLNIETHYWIVRRATRLLMKERDIL